VDATTSQKLTFDTDNGRTNSHPCIILLPSGQQIIFYSKFLTTGKESFSRISFIASSFTINVEAGNGTINGTPVTWSAGSVTATADTYQIVYVTDTGIIGIGSNLNMAFLSDVILLAYVGSGSTSITRISEIEHTGNYIYVRKQTWTGTEWVWDDYENLLNTGSEPSCFYNSGTGYIYLSYKKDSSSYSRLFNPLDELTWEYLQNINIIANAITLNRNPENSLFVSGNSSGYKSIVDISNNIYPISSTGFTFVDNQPYVFLPIVSGDYLRYIRGGITYDFFKLVGSSYTLEASYTLQYPFSLSFNDRFKIWVGTTGTKYVGIRLNSSLFLEEYISSPSSYGSFDLYLYPAKVTFDMDQYTTNATDNSLFGVVSSGYKSNVVTTVEYTELKTFKEDAMSDAVVSSGYKSNIVMTAEYTELKTSKEDIMSDSAISSGYEALMIINSLPIV
jgi:hypothetical protein